MIKDRATRVASTDKPSGSMRTIRSLIRYWSPGYSPLTMRDESIETITDDGLKLRIEYLRSRIQNASKPVVLQHGLAANGLVFNYPGHSLAAYLSERGFDCYIPDLRGARCSDEPKGDWSLDDLIEYDVPAIVHAVLEHSRSDRLHWIGHSLGGILMLMYGIENPETPVESFASIGSALDYRPGTRRNIYPKLIPWISVANSLHLASFPYHLLSRMGAPMAGRGIRLLPELMNFRRDNIDPEILRMMLAHGFAKAPYRLLQGLSGLFSKRGLVHANRAIGYRDQANRFRPRSLLIGGSRDVQCPAEAVEETARRLNGAREVRVVHFGTKHGHACEYGHIDLILGKNAEREVWPHLFDWLMMP